MLRANLLDSLRRWLTRRAYPPGLYEWNGKGFTRIDEPGKVVPYRLKPNSLEDDKCWGISPEYRSQLEREKNA